MKCRNPECRKELPEGLNYCNEDCLRRHIQIKKEAKSAKAPKEPLRDNDNDGTNERNLWVGQDRRKRAMKTIMRIAEELLPMSYKRFACQVSYKTGLSLRKITDDYLEVLSEIGFLEYDGYTLRVLKEFDEEVR
jgi:hypothetical protein